MLQIARESAVIVVAFLLGVACTVGYVAVSGGWYEYRIATSVVDQLQLVNEERWEPTPGISVESYGARYLRRPRIQLP